MPIQRVLNVGCDRCGAVEQRPESNAELLDKWAAVWPAAAVPYGHCYPGYRDEHLLIVCKGCLTEPERKQVELEESLRGEFPSDVPF